MHLPNSNLAEGRASKFWSSELSNEENELVGMVVSKMLRSYECVCVYHIVSAAARVVDKRTGKNSNAPGTPAQGEWQARSNGRFYSWSKADCGHSR